MGHVQRALWWRLLAIITALLLIPQSLALAGGPASGTSPGVDLPTVAPGRSPLQPSEENEDQLLKVNDATTSNKLAGDSPLSVEQAGAERAAAAQYAEYLKTHGHLPKGPATFSGAWSAAGPQPIYELGQSSLYNEGVANFVAMNGRIGALAIRSDGTFILGGAQGGIWTFDGQHVDAPHRQPAVARHRRTRNCAQQRQHRVRRHG